MVFNKIDAYKPKPWDENELVEKEKKSTITLMNGKKLG